MKNVFKKASNSFREFFKVNHRELTFISVALAALGGIVFFGGEVMAQQSIGGTDASDKLEMAATTLRTVDSVLFKWIAPLLAGVFVIVTGVWIKEQRYSLAAMSLIAALLLGTAGQWVSNIFAIGNDGEGAGGVFNNGYIERVIEDVRVV